MSKEPWETLANFADFDLTVFTGLVSDLMGLYETSKMRIVLAGSGSKPEIDDIDAKLIRKKRGIGEGAFTEIVGSIVLCMHFVIAQEVSDVSKLLEKAKDKKTANKFLEKAKIIEKVVEAHPTIRMGHNAYTLTRTGFFDDITWVAELKVFHSSSQIIPEPHPAIPVGRVGLSIAKCEDKEIKTESREFEISLMDLQYMIKSLQDLQQAMYNLDKRKLVDK